MFPRLRVSEARYCWSTPTKLGMHGTAKLGIGEVTSHFGKDNNTRCCDLNLEILRLQQFAERPGEPNKRDSTVKML
jgi:hypothetical protein